MKDADSTVTEEKMLDRAENRTHGPIGEEESEEKPTPKPNVGGMPGGEGQGGPPGADQGGELNQTGEAEKERIRQSERGVGEVGFGSLGSKKTS